MGEVTCPGREDCVCLCWRVSVCGSCNYSYCNICLFFESCHLQLLESITLTDATHHELRTRTHTALTEVATLLGKVEQLEEDKTSLSKQITTFLDEKSTTVSRMRVFLMQCSCSAWNGYAELCYLAGTSWLRDDGN